PSAAEPAPSADGPRLLTLSARTPTALARLAQRYADHLAAHPSARLADVCRTSNAGRADLSERAALVVSSIDDLQLRLRDLAAGETPRGAMRGRRPDGDPPRVAFLFSGQG